MSPLTIPQSALVFGVALTVWRLLRHFLAKTSVDNIPGPSSNSFVKGNIGQLFDTNGWEFHSKIAQEFGRIASVHGLFGEKQLYISDPKALYHILVKDQDSFDIAESTLVMSFLVFGISLFSTRGDQHRKYRKMMNPVFSVAHLRDMIPMFYDVANKIHMAIEKDLADGPHDIDILRWMTRAALEMIGQGGLGHSFDPLINEESENNYTKSVKEVFPTILRLKFAQEFLLSTVAKIGTPKFRRACLEWVPSKNLQKVKEMSDILGNTSNEIFENKKRALEKGEEAFQEQVGRGKDIINILMKANLAALEPDRMENEEVLGQMTALIFAAMDTTSSALSRTLFNLAQHPEVQEKLRREIREARQYHSELEIPHDELMALPYLDAICRETLRLYPPVPLVLRTCQKDTVLPLSRPIKGRDGNEIHEIAVPKNSQVIISVLNANNDSTLWGTDASEWKPERWLSPLPTEVLEARVPGVYSHLMTFIGGGRSCIGFKFSQLEMKVVLSVLIDNFRFSPSKEEIIWEMGIVAIPTLKGKSGKPTLPIRMERLA